VERGYVDPSSLSWPMAQEDLRRPVLPWVAAWRASSHDLVRFPDVHGCVDSLARRLLSASSCDAEYVVQWCVPETSPIRIYRRVLGRPPQVTGGGREGTPTTHSVSNGGEGTPTTHSVSNGGGAGRQCGKHLSCRGSERRIQPPPRQDGQTDILPRHSPRYTYASRGKNA